MKTWDIFLIFGTVLCLFVTCYAKRGFILTAPKSIDAGTTEYFTFTAFEVPSGGVVTLKLLHFYTEEVLAESKVNVLNNLNMWVEMTIPPSSTDLKAKLKVEGTFSDGYKIDTSKEVHIRHNSIVTFVQTDKPVYKPGQIVRFRVMPLDNQLKSLGENVFADIWIEDPTDIRVAQWKKVKFDEGMVQLELPLSNEPPLGTWKIKCTVNQVSHTQNFNVEKYVLPKFDVKINPPSYVMADADTIPLEICAWYTYGKKVDGIFKTKVTYKKYTWENKRRTFPSFETSGPISGCETLHIKTQDIQLQTSEFGFRILEFFAEVTENTTAITRNFSTTMDITHASLRLKFLGSEGHSDYYKPGIPFYGELSVEKPDYSSASNEKVEICSHFQYKDTGRPGQHTTSTEVRCHIFTSNKKGRIRFSVFPKSSNTTKIHLTAKAVNYHPKKYHKAMWQIEIARPGAKLELHPWFSPSGKYLQIQPVSNLIECEKLQRVKVRYSAEKGAAVKFYHQVLSRGRIVQQGSHQRTFYSKVGENRHYDLEEPESASLDDGFTQSFSWSRARSEPSIKPSIKRSEIGEFLLSFDPRATMSPIARLLVFYVTDDGEIVADSRMFRIDNCLLNKVNLHFRHEQQYPSTEASILLSASPSSVCGIGMVDKSIRLLKQEGQFKKDNIFKLMEKYDVGKANQPHQASDDYCARIQANGDNVGFPPAPIPYYYSRLTRGISLQVDTSMAFDEAGMVVISNFEVETRPCIQSNPIAIAYMVPEDGRPGLNFDSSVSLSRRGFDHIRPIPKKAIIKEEEPPKASEVEEIRSYFPETWLWEMHIIGSSGEIALKRRLPDTITQWVGEAVCIHPKVGLGLSDSSVINAFQPFFLSFQLPYSVIRGESLPLVVSVFNYLSECLPIKLSLEPNDKFRLLSESRFHTMCVCGGQSKGHRFVIKPLALGKVNVTVYGFSLEDDEEFVCGNEVTARLNGRDAVKKQLLVEAEGFPKEEVFNYFVCPQSTNGSYATEVDLLLPEDVVEGSGRAYLTVTGDIMGPALNGLSKLVRLPVGCGEQNMVLFTPNIFVLDYLTATGKLTDKIKTDCLNNMKMGYQRELKYRHKDGSYSAFGDSDPEGSLWLTAFVLRSFGQARRFVDVDEHDLRLSTTWVLSKQFENGCFEPTGYLLNKAMKGGLSEGDQSLSPLTAYVIIALLESGVQRPHQTSVRNAFKCLETDANPNSYALALYSYASSLAKETLAFNKYRLQLEDRAIVKNRLQFWQSDSKDGGSKSVNVEIAGYYILAQLEMVGAMSRVFVLPVVRWLIQQRNSQGGFVSTQDTVVALQALARYSSLHQLSTLDMGLVVESDEMVKGFKLEENNKLVTQTADIPILPAVVDLQAVGDGCAVVQFSLRYNVEKVKGGEAFDLNIDAVRLGSSNCNLPRISICMRYKILDQVSNMVVVSVKMASGFIPDEWSLYELQSDQTVKMMRHEVDGNQLNLYFNKISNEQTCFKFFVKSELEVEDIKPASVKLYDYYQTELEVSKEYTIPSACTVSILPDMPRLPPLLIDTDNDDAVLPESSTVPLEEETFSYITEPVAPYTAIEFSNLSTTNDISPDTISLIDETSKGPTDVMDSTDITTKFAYQIATDETPLESLNSIPADASFLTPFMPGSETSTNYDGDQNEDSFTTYGLSEFSSESDTQKHATTVILQESSSDKTDQDIELQTALGSSGLHDSDTLTGDQEATVTAITNEIDHLLEKSSSHLSNFIDVDKELEFPNGIEGNVPVSITPPFFVDLASVTEISIVDCPTCVRHFPENISDIYICTDVEIKVLLKDTTTGTVEIIEETNSLHSPQVSIMKLAVLEYDERCQCPPLHESDSTLLLLGTVDLLDSKSENIIIHLKNDTTVIPLSSQSSDTHQLISARNACTNEP